MNEILILLISLFNLIVLFLVQARRLRNLRELSDQLVRRVAQLEAQYRLLNPGMAVAWKNGPGHTWVCDPYSEECASFNDWEYSGGWVRDRT